MADAQRASFHTEPVSLSRLTHMRALLVQKAPELLATNFPAPKQALARIEQLPSDWTLKEVKPLCLHPDERVPMQLLEELSLEWSTGLSSRRWHRLALLAMEYADWWARARQEDWTPLLDTLQYTGAPQWLHTAPPRSSVARDPQKRMRERLKKLATLFQQARSPDQLKKFLSFRSTRLFELLAQSAGAWDQELLAELLTRNQQFGHMDLLATLSENDSLPPELVARLPLHNLSLRASQQWPHHPHAGHLSLDQLAQNGQTACWEMLGSPRIPAEQAIRVVSRHFPNVLVDYLTTHTHLSRSGRDDRDLLEELEPADWAPVLGEVPPKISRELLRLISPQALPFGFPRFGPITIVRSWRRVSPFVAEAVGAPGGPWSAREISGRSAHRAGWPAGYVPGPDRPGPANRS